MPFQLCLLPTTTPPADPYPNRSIVSRCASGKLRTPLFGQAPTGVVHCAEGSRASAPRRSVDSGTLQAKSCPNLSQHCLIGQGSMLRSPGDSNNDATACSRAFSRAGSDRSMAFATGSARRPPCARCSQTRCNCYPPLDSMEARRCLFVCLPTSRERLQRRPQAQLHLRRVSYVNHGVCWDGVEDVHHVACHPETVSTHIQSP